MKKTDEAFLERAHLRDERGFSPPIHRYCPSPETVDVVRRYWVPVWNLSPGVESTQRVLQYPVCLLVIGHDYASLVGPTSGLATKHLVGAGWAVGAMLQPATGRILLGEDIVTLTDTQIDLTSSRLADASRLIAQVRAAMSDPADEAGRQDAVRLLNRALANLCPIDSEGVMVNEIVNQVENDPDLHRVSQICRRFDLTERALQRLMAKRVGLSPKWLIRRRRLHGAAQRLSGDAPALADLAASLGYADQSHFQRDFKSVTGMTPTTYAMQATAV